MPFTFAKVVSSVFSIQNSNFQIVSIVIATLLTIAVTAGMFINRKLKEFIVDAGDELSRVAWPTFIEAQKTTAIVIALIIVSSIVLFFTITSKNLSLQSKKQLNYEANLLKSVSGASRSDMVVNQFIF